MATACYKAYFRGCILDDHYQYVGGAGADKLACPDGAALIEAESIWPDMPSGQPDVLVSIGCGHGEAPAEASSAKDCSNVGAMWSESFGEMSQDEPERYIRLCLEFSTESVMPDASNVDELRNISFLKRVSAALNDGEKQAISQDNLRGNVFRVARRLIATTFYFDKVTSKPCQEGGLLIYGMSF